MTYAGLRGSHKCADKTQMETLQLLLNKLQLCQRALGFEGERALIDQVQRAYFGEPQFKIALFNQYSIFE
jgi:hypothetical protein